MLGASEPALRPRVLIVGCGFGGPACARGLGSWILWLILHVYLLVGLEKRVLATILWLGRCFTRQRGARPID